MTLILGVDPGLVHTGWGIIHSSGNALTLVAAGVIKGESTALKTQRQANKKAPANPYAQSSQPSHHSILATRLHTISFELADVISRFGPEEAAVEETFVNVNGQSTLKLGQARGAILLTLAQAGLVTHEYAATLVKKSVVGAGRAEKSQIAHMVQLLLPGCGKYGADTMDALAVAITHAHHRKSAQL